MIGAETLNSMVADAMRADAMRRSGQNGRQVSPTAVPVPVEKPRPGYGGDKLGTPMTVDAGQSVKPQYGGSPTGGVYSPPAGTITRRGQSYAPGQYFAERRPYDPRFEQAIRGAGQPQTAQSSGQPPVASQAASGDVVAQGKAMLGKIDRDGAAAYGYTDEQVKKLREGITALESSRSGLADFKEGNKGLFQGNNPEAKAARSRRDSLRGEMRELRNRMMQSSQDATPSYADVTNGYLDRLDEARGGPDNRTGEEVLADQARRSRTGYMAEGTGASGGVVARGGNYSTQPAMPLGAFPTMEEIEARRQARQPVVHQFGGDYYDAARQLVDNAPDQYIGPNLAPDRDTAIALTAERIASSRERYGGNAAGTAQINDDYVSLIQNRTDLDPAAKQSLINRHYAKIIARGGSIGPMAPVGPGLNAEVQRIRDQEAANRQDNIDRGVRRQKFWDEKYARRAAAAQQQQQMMMMDMLSRSAAMGNPEAARMLGQMQQGQADIYRQNMQNMLGMQQIQSRERMGQAEINSRENLAAMEDARERERMANQNSLDERRVGLLEEEAKSKQAVADLQAEKLRLDLEFERETIPERKAAIANEIKEKEVAIESAQTKLEIDKLKLKEAQVGGPAAPPPTLQEEIATQADADPAASPQELRYRAVIAAASRELTALAQSGDSTATALLTVPKSSEDVAQMSPGELAMDYVSRIASLVGNGNGLRSLSGDALRAGFAQEGLDMPRMQAAATEVTQSLGENTYTVVAPGVPSLDDMANAKIIDGETYIKFAEINTVRRAAGLPEVVPSGAVVQKDIKSQDFLRNRPDGIMAPPGRMF